MNDARIAPEAGGPPTARSERAREPASAGTGSAQRGRPSPADRSGDIAPLWIAPGPRQRELCAVLNALAPASAFALPELYVLPAAPEGALDTPVLFLDGDHLALEDIGWIRHLVATGRVRRVVALGTEPATRTARALRGLQSSHWAVWPPDLDELKSWLDGARALRADRAPSVGELRAGSPSAETTAQSSAGERSWEAPDADTPELAPRPPAAPTAPTALALGRDQVAVLADIAQGLELAFLALRESANLPQADLEGPQIELRRLLRFTRSLACLTAPPPRGSDEFDVASLIEELLTTLVLRGRKGPRFQPNSGSGGRPAPVLMVRADRAALTMAFETVFGFARLCSSGGDTIRVAYTPLASGAISIQVEFPAGPLHGAPPEKVLDVAMLRERLPDLDPNELAAAGAILRSQGGSLEVASPADGQLAVRMSLPMERGGEPVQAPLVGGPGGGGAAPGGGSKRPAPARVDDPFA